MRIYRVQHHMHNGAPVPEWVKEFTHEWYFACEGSARAKAYELAFQFSWYSHEAAKSIVQARTDEITRRKTWLDAEDNEGRGTGFGSYDYIQAKLKKHVSEFDQFRRNTMEGTDVFWKPSADGNYYWDDHRITVKEIAVDNACCGS